MTEQALVPIDRLAGQVDVWELTAIELDVVNQAGLERGAALLRDIKALVAEIQKSTRPVIQAAKAAHSAALKQEKDLLAPLEEAETLIKRKVQTYVTEEERKAREQAALEAAAAREQQEKAEREARELAEMGEHELAEHVREEAAAATALPIVPAPPKAQGIVTPETWHFEVVDLKALVSAVARGDVPLAALLANEKVLGQQARALRAELQWPGVRVYSQRGVTVR